MCWLGCRVGLGEEGLVGREVLMDFRLVSQFLFTQERWGVGGSETKRKNKHQIHEHVHTYTGDKLGGKKRMLKLTS